MSCLVCGEYKRWKLSTGRCGACQATYWWQIQDLRNYGTKGLEALIDPDVLIYDENVQYDYP